MNDKKWACLGARSFRNNIFLLALFILLVKIFFLISHCWWKNIPQNHFCQESWNLILNYRSGSNNMSSSASINRSGTPNRSSHSFGEADSRRIRSYSSDPTSASGKKHELSRLPPLPSRFKDLVLVCKDKDTGAARLHLKL